MIRFLLCFFLLSTVAFSQAKFTVYFDTDSHQLTPPELTRLDVFLKNKDLKFLKIIGFCDYRATNAYNDTLALNRANYVYHIIEKVTNQKQIEIESKGENFEQNSDLKLNRKVEIFYEELVTEKILPKDDKKDLSQQVSTAKVGNQIIYTLKVNNVYGGAEIGMVDANNNYYVFSSQFKRTYGSNSRFDNYDLVTSIIDNNIDLELSDNEYVGIIQKIKVWINENKISELKEKVKTTSDINEKLKLMDEIAVLKRKGV